MSEELDVAHSSTLGLPPCPQTLEFGGEFKSSHGRRRFRVCGRAVGSVYADLRSPFTDEKFAERSEDLVFLDMFVCGDVSERAFVVSLEW